MALAVCLLFDGRSERRLLAMWQALDSRGVPTLLTHTHRRHVPHLSLVVLRRYDVEEVRRALAALPASAPCEVHFDAVARFRRGRVALVGAVSAELISRQARAVAAAEGVGAEVHTYYRPGRWIPHTSVATRARRSQEGDLVAAHDMLPLTATLTRAALIDNSTGQRWRLDHLV